LLDAEAHHFLERRRARDSAIGTSKNPVRVPFHDFFMTPVALRLFEKALTERGIGFGGRVSAERPRRAERDETCNPCV